MTDWKFEYEHPPLTDEDWAKEFEKYKQSPEYKKSNLGMTVEEYKFIYWMEYGHRMWGRVLGLYFVAPRLRLHLQKRLNGKIDYFLNLEQEKITLR